jgi:hypothetical protein
VPCCALVPGPPPSFGCLFGHDDKRLAFFDDIAITPRGAKRGKLVRFSRRFLVWKCVARIARATHVSQIDWRRDLNDARISAVKSTGCSQAAKWVPLSTLL